MNIRKFAVSAMAFLLAAMTLASCSSGAGSSTDTTAAPNGGNAVTTAADTEPAGPTLDKWGREIISDDLPADLNFGSKEVKILAREDTKFRWQLDFYAPEITGEMVKDAVYERNARIEERLGVKFVITEGPGSYTNFSQYADMITKAYQSGSHDYDMVGTYSLYGAQYATQGYFYNINDLGKYINLDKVWWNQNFKDELTVDNKLYFVVGDVNLTALSRMLTLFYNKEEVEKRLPNVDLYATVNDGKWTLDYMTELLADSYADLNGDTAKNDGDFFGLVTTKPSEAFDSFAASTHFQMIVRDNEGNFVLNADTESLVNRIDKIAKLYYSDENAVMFDTIDNSLNRFANGQALFTLYTLDKAGEDILRNMTQSYGVLPLPKYDEAQDMYRTIPQDAFNLISIMGDTEDPDMIAAVLELMCAESYKEVVPLYYEEALKYKYMPDEDSGKMIDYLRDGLTFDFATINTLSLQSAGHFVRSTLNDHGIDAASRVSSSMAMRQKIFKKALEQFVAKYEAIGQ
ncbi:MAG: hypothetical protein IJX53_05955 [Clostridia bacterium]|nr:hypothetical protein [Clostridia bacterium]